MSKRYTQEELDKLDGKCFPTDLLHVYREDYLKKVEFEVEVVLSSLRQTYDILVGKDIPLSAEDTLKLESLVRSALFSERHTWVVTPEVVQVLADRYARMFKANY